MSGFMQNPTTLGARKIGLEDSFQFKCNACGNCCRGRQNEIFGTSIFLSGPDVWRIMDHIKLSFDELLEKHISVNIDADLKLKTCSLKFKYSGSCTFLKKGTCSIYEARPRTCALYPLGRAVIFNQIGRQLYHYEDNYTISGFEPNYKCDYTSNNTYKVTEWIVKNGVPINDVDDIEWFRELANYSYKANKKYLKVEELNDIFVELYKKHSSIKKF